MQTRHPYAWARHGIGTRGTSSFLGTKRERSKPFSKSWGNGRPGKLGPGSSGARKPRPATSVATLDSPLDAPRLYHGQPSGNGSGDDPPGSAQVLSALASELLALEGRLNVRPSSRAAVTNAVPEAPVATTRGNTAVGGVTPEPTPASKRRSDATQAPGVRPASSRWDDFGRDAKALEQFSPIATFLSKYYFRVKVTGIEHIPSSGPCLLVANHSGAIPIDGLAIKSALWAAHPAKRHVRWLTEDFVQNLPFIGTYLQRLGAVRASRENALRLLESGECVLAFPEGFKGYAKPRSQWYRVQRLGRGRIVSLCLHAGVPLLPCAVVGAEEASPSLRRLEAVERWLGAPYFPITRTFPWLGPVGLMPAPTRWYIDIGPPFLEGSEATRADDPLHVAELTAELRTVLQSRVDQLLEQRKHS